MFYCSLFSFPGKHGILSLVINMMDVDKKLIGKRHFLYRVYSFTQLCGRCTRKDGNGLHIVDNIGYWRGCRNNQKTRNLEWGSTSVAYYEQPFSPVILSIGHYRKAFEN